MTTRAAFLAGLTREVQRAGPAFAAAPTAPAADPERALAAALAAAARDAAALAARFTAEAERVGAIVHRAADVAGAAAVVLSVARALGARRLASWSADALGPLAPVLDAARRGGLELTPCPAAPADAAARAEFRAALAAAEIGLTGADLALAASGSVLLLSGPGRGRGVSLLPPVHVALVPRDRLVEGLAEGGLALAAWADRPGPAGGANAVLVTGPSRTADIELTLTRGVHGPRELHLVLVGSG